MSSKESAHRLFVQKRERGTELKPKIIRMNSLLTPYRFCKAIYNGELVCMGLIHAFGLWCDARSPEGLAKMRKAKNRPKDQPVSCYGPWELIPEIADWSRIDPNYYFLREHPKLLYEIGNFFIRFPISAETVEKHKVPLDILMTSTDDEGSYYTMHLVSANSPGEKRIMYKAYKHQRPDGLSPFVAVSSLNKRGKDNVVFWDDPRAEQNALEFETSLVILPPYSTGQGQYTIWDISKEAKLPAFRPSQIFLVGAEGGRGTERIVRKTFVNEEDWSGKTVKVGQGSGIEDGEYERTMVQGSIKTSCQQVGRWMDHVRRELGEEYLAQLRIEKINE